MTKKEKYLIGAGAAGSALLMIAIAAVQVPKNSEPPKVAAEIAPAPRQTAESLQSVAVRSVPASIPPTVAGPIPPLPAAATSIPDENLQKLSLMVGLADAGGRHPDKGQWAQALPVAQKLLQGPCDCEQRNWLNRFVEMGNFALSGSDDQYFQYARIMATMGRNDKQAMAISHKPN